MKVQEIEQYLTRHGVKPTAVRMVVWSTIFTKHSPFTLKDAEKWLPYMDRSSIFRALRLFASQQLLHEIDDGSGICKYCVCHCDTEGHRGHVHFKCVSCGKTYCLSDTEIPAVTLPEGFIATEAEYIIKGQCATCRS